VAANLATTASFRPRHRQKSYGLGSDADGRLAVRATWRELPLTPQPPQRYGGTLVEDQSGTCLLVGGGTNEYSPRDTWRFDGERWTELCGPREGPDVVGAAACATGQQVVLFGADHFSNATSRPGKTWLWDGSSWESVTTPQAPTARCDASLAYSPSEGAPSCSAVRALLLGWAISSTTPGRSPASPGRACV
jgi:hypothetical protein